MSLLPGTGVVYAGGYFTSIGGQSRSYIAALSTSTGLATSWNPIASAHVEALAMGSSVVYAGGAFMTIGGQPRSRLAALASGIRPEPATPAATNGIVWATREPSRSEVETSGRPAGYPR